MKAPSLWLIALTAAALALVAMGACSTRSSVLSLDDYDTSCVADGDCVEVYIGDICPCGGGCANAAISLSALDKYRDDFTEAYDGCDQPPNCEAAMCAAPRVFCQAGRCALDPTGSTGGGGTGGSGNAGGTGGSGNAGGTGGASGGTGGASGGAGGGGGFSGGAGGGGGASSGGGGAG